MLNPKLDKKSLTRAFAVDKRLVIENFISPDIAERIRKYCLESVPFNMIYVLDGQYQVTSQAEMAAMNAQQKEQINQKIMLAASQGEGFLYGGYMIKRQEQTDEKMRFLQDVVTYLNSEEPLAMIRGITGQEDINCAEGQYTRFTPGHFLTRHHDDAENRHRRLAYVLGLTKEWHPDWGGLLQFYQQDGTPRDAWMPRFNCLSLFEVSHVHAVTYITPYAKAPRLSLTGWFRAGQAE